MSLGDIYEKQFKTFKKKTRIHPALRTNADRDRTSIDIKIRKLRTNTANRNFNSACGFL